MQPPPATPDRAESKYDANSTPQSINIDGLKRSVSGVRAMFEGNKSTQQSQDSQSQQERQVPAACKSLKERMAALQADNKPADPTPSQVSQVKFMDLLA
jgi:hypothetical protein